MTLEDRDYVCFLDDANLVYWFSLQLSLAACMTLTKSQNILASANISVKEILKSFLYLLQFCKTYETLEQKIQLFIGEKAACKKESVPQEKVKVLRILGFVCALSQNA